MASGQGRSQAEAQLGHCSPGSGLLLLSHPPPPRGSRARKQRRMEPGSLNHPLQPNPLQVLRAQPQAHRHGQVRGPGAMWVTFLRPGEATSAGNTLSWRLSWLRASHPFLLGNQDSRGPGNLPLRLDADATLVLTCTLLRRWQE